LRFYQIDPVVGFDLNQYPEYGDLTNHLKQYIENVYGYDEFGSEIEDGPDKAREPNFLSFHLEDNIRSKNSVISLGMRVDRFFTDDRILRNPDDLDIDFSRSSILDHEWQEQDAYWYLSPRIGVVIQTGDLSFLRINYNRQLQPPPLRNSYYSRYNYDRQLVIGGYFYYWPIGFDLRPIEANLVDISFTKNVSKLFNLSGTVFYKRSSGQIQVDRHISDWDQTYFIMSNLGVNEIHGLDIHAYIHRFKRFQFLLNYTYNYARGNGSDELSNYMSLYRGMLGSGKYSTSSKPLNFVPEHKIIMDIDFRFGHNDGGPILENLGLNLLLKGDSGFPYTTVYVPPGGGADFYSFGVDYIIDRRSSMPIEPLNSSNTGWRLNFDLRVDKSFYLGKNIFLMFYMRVLNLFNTRHVENVYPFSGTAEVDGFINDIKRSASRIEWAGERGRDIYNAINTMNGQSYWDKTGNELYGNPRQIFLGLRLTY
jgi:hypothetical protein